MSAVRLIRRIHWLGNLLSTQVSFALGALCVFIPMFPPMVAYESRAKRAEAIAKGAIDINLELHRN